MKSHDPRKVRQAIADAADLAGIACLFTAAWSWNELAGLIVTGVGLVVLGWLIDR